MALIERTLVNCTQSSEDPVRIPALKADVSVASGLFSQTVMCLFCCSAADDEGDDVPLRRRRVLDTEREAALLPPPPPTEPVEEESLAAQC